MITKTVKYVLLCGFCLGISACTITPVISATPQSTLVTPTATPDPQTEVHQTASVTLDLSPTPSPDPTLIPSTPVPPTPPGLNITNLKVTVLAQGLAGPDDLVLGPDGSIYVSDVNAGSILQVQADGTIHTIVAGLFEPEGMVFLPDGNLIIAEQGKNRLVRYDFKTKQTSLFLALKNETGLAGVDGIVIDDHDRSHETIIVPDSPNGKILRVSLDGKTVTTLATGFARPTGAWVEPDGSLLVVDENAGILARIRPDGKMERLASLSIPDDVIADSQGNIFVATLGDHAIHVLSGSNYHDQVLGVSLNDPQGVIFSMDGNLIIADQGNHRLIEIAIH